MKVIIFSILLFWSALAEKIVNIHQAVNKSGLQRMLTQRMLKEYIMIAMNSTFDNPQEGLKRDIELFDKNLEELSKFAKNSKIKDSLAKEKSIWEDVKKPLLLPPTKDKAKAIEQKLDKLLKVADHTTKLFEKESSKKADEIVDISGRQRMLSQKMAAHYMLKVLGTIGKDDTKELQDTISLFDNSLKVLMKSKLNTPEITEKLNSVQKDFTFFKVMSKSNSKFIPSLIYRKSNLILQEMNGVTELYVIELSK